MLINGCLATCDGVDESIAEEMFEGLDYKDEIDNESLAAISGDYVTYVIDGSDKDFNIISDEEEYRCIHENDIDRIYRDEAADYYDLDEWKSAVENNGTEEGFYDWQESVLDEADYGQFFAHYDGDYTSIGDYYVFRVN